MNVRFKESYTKYKLNYIKTIFKRLFDIIRLPEMNPIINVYSL